MKVLVVILSLFLFGSVSCMHHQGSHHRGKSMMKKKYKGHHRTCALCNKKDKRNCDCHKKKKYRSHQKGMYRSQKKGMRRSQSHHKKNFRHFKQRHSFDNAIGE